MAQWVCYNDDKVVVEYCDNEARSKFHLPDHLHWGPVSIEIPADKQNRKHTYDPATKLCTDIEPEVSSTELDGLNAEAGITADNVGKFKA